MATLPCRVSWSPTIDTLYQGSWNGGPWSRPGPSDSPVRTIAATYQLCKFSRVSCPGELTQLTSACTLPKVGQRREGLHWKGHSEVWCKGYCVIKGHYDVKEHYDVNGHCDVKGHYNVRGNCDVKCESVEGLELQSVPPVPRGPTGETHPSPPVPATHHSDTMRGEHSTVVTSTEI